MDGQSRPNPPISKQEVLGRINWLTSRYNLSYNVVFLDDVIFQYSPTHAVSKHKKSVRYCCQSLIFLRIQASNQKWEWNRDLADAHWLTKVKPRQNILSIASSILFHPEESSFLVVKRSNRKIASQTAASFEPASQVVSWHTEFIKLITREHCAAYSWHTGRLSGTNMMKSFWWSNK